MITHWDVDGDGSFSSPGDSDGTASLFMSDFEGAWEGKIKLMLGLAVPPDSWASLYNNSANFINQTNAWNKLVSTSYKRLSEFAKVYSRSLGSISCATTLMLLSTSLVPNFFPADRGSEETRPSARRTDSRTSSARSGAARQSRISPSASPPAELPRIPISMIKSCLPWTLSICSRWTSGDREIRRCSARIRRSGILRRLWRRLGRSANLEIGPNHNFEQVR